MALRRGKRYKLRVVFAELKTEGKRPTAEQVEWLQALASVEALHVYRWTPDDWDEIMSVLRMP